VGVPNENKEEDHPVDYTIEEYDDEENPPING
jgi:hypothetical protein